MCVALSHSALPDEGTFGLYDRPVLTSKLFMCFQVKKKKVKRLLHKYYFMDIYVHYCVRIDTSGFFVCLLLFCFVFWGGGLVLFLLKYEPWLNHYIFIYCLQFRTGVPNENMETGNVNIGYI